MSQDKLSATIPYKKFSIIVPLFSRNNDFMGCSSGLQILNCPIWIKINEKTVSGYEYFKSTKVLMRI